MPVIQALSSTPANRNLRVYDSVYTVDTGWRHESYETTLNANYEHETCASYSTGYEYSADAGTTETDSYSCCTDRTGAFTYVETIKTTNENVKYKYYCQVNS